MVTTGTELLAQVIQLTYEIGECVESHFPAEAIDSDYAPAGKGKLSSVLAGPSHFLVRLKKSQYQYEFSPFKTSVSLSVLRACCKIHKCHLIKWGNYIPEHS